MLDKDYMHNKVYKPAEAKVQLQVMVKSLDETSLELIREGQDKFEQAKILRELTEWSLPAAQDVIESIKEQLWYLPKN